MEVYKDFPRRHDEVVLHPGGSACRSSRQQSRPENIRQPPRDHGNGRQHDGRRGQEEQRRRQDHQMDTRPGPEDQFQTFIDRVNNERISLKNLYIFHMDFGLDWNSRTFPEGNNWHSPQGRMKVRFYGKIDPELNVPEEQRIWPTLQDLDLVDRKIEELGGVDTSGRASATKGSSRGANLPRTPISASPKRCTST